MSLGFMISKADEEIMVKRGTKETRITVTINETLEKTYPVDTSVEFLNHMIETLSWRANLNIGIKTELFMKLTHPVCEDAGITIGRALLELYTSKLPNGVEGVGFDHGILDEANADASVSIEGRANCYINGSPLKNVEGITGYDLVAFLEGFCQGCKCTLQIRYDGRDPHHIWEAVFRALGMAIRKVLLPNPWRKNTIAGLKGTID